MFLHLHVLLLRPRVPSPKEFHIPLLPLSLSHHVETLSSPTKHTQSAIRSLYRCGTIKYTSVEMPGIEPGSTMPLLRRNYNNSFTAKFIYCQTRSDPPPRLENVETIVPTRISQQQRPRQWPNCNLDSFVILPRFQLDHGIQQQGHCNYGKHDQHD
jgi:hypothetical protein